MKERLALLTRPEGEQAGWRLLPHLHWSPVIDATELAVRAEVSTSEAAAGLAWLAARGADREHHLVTPDLTCDCAWYREHPGDRGPCKHVLAAVIIAREADPAGC